MKAYAVGDTNPRSVILLPPSGTFFRKAKPGGTHMDSTGGTHLGKAGWKMEFRALQGFACGLVSPPVRGLARLTTVPHLSKYLRCALSHGVA
jgi:hypothetical protein